MKGEIKIGFLDHVALRVRDLEISTAWYKQVLGMKKHKLPEWGEFPIFMLYNKCGVALFPAVGIAEDQKDSNNVGMDHFAFNVDKVSFEIAKKKYTELGLDFSIQDHHYFHSIYTKDPDGHVVKLTTIVVDEAEFY